MAMGCRLNYQTKAPKTAPYSERLQSLRLRANRSVRRNYCEPYIDLKVIRADFFDFEAETGKNFISALHRHSQPGAASMVLPNTTPLQAPRPRRYAPDNSRSRNSGGGPLSLISPLPYLDLNLTLYDSFLFRRNP